MKLLLFAVVFYLAVTVKAQDCTALANAGNCDFYTQCVETKFQCGTNGYPSAYGDRYCRQFTNKRTCFTFGGKTWANNTYICLMRAILYSNVYCSTGTCSQLQTQAFNNHSSCYNSNRFCTDILLSVTNLNCLAYEVFSSNDFWNKQAIQQILDTAITCTKQVANSFLSSVDNWISNAEQLVTRQLLQTLKELLGGCKSGLDIIFVLDASGSIGSSNFVTMKNFVKTIISNFEIGANKTRVGVIRFSSSASIVIALGSINNAGQLRSSITNIVYTSGGTATHLALNLLHTAFSNARSSQGVPRVAIVFTDGQSNSRSSTTRAAQLVYAAGIVVYSFGIGIGIDKTELNTIASSSNNVFVISNFSPTQFAAKLLPLQTSACTTPAITSINDGIKASLGQNESRLLQYAFPSEGFTVKVNIISGELKMQGSFSVRNPTSLTSDFSIQRDNATGINYFVSPALRQSSTGSSSNTTASVYLSFVGLQANNTFILNTTYGDTSGALGMKTAYIPLLVLVAMLFAVLQ